MRAEPRLLSVGSFALPSERMESQERPASLQLWTWNPNSDSFLCSRGINSLVKPKGSSGTPLNRVEEVTHMRHLLKQ
ncbi:hypothetical protein MRB53_029243 [Persea americana]|uniref:Uncharacterized protein n=1 Tax=Persea americana TaxID=3435 RepID=A0ACC2KIE3_PERAE|nr:hypothetical protein MRB53_029243 [Persea americana]